MNDEKERADFEAWYGTHHEVYDTTFIYYKKENRYQRPSVDESWAAYQAGRAALQSQDREDAGNFGAIRSISEDELNSLKKKAWAMMDSGRRGRHVQVEANTLLDLVAMAKAYNHARRIDGEGE